MAEASPAAAGVPVVAIDGPSGAGKSTVARGVAAALGWRYLDTGAMYRAITVAVLDRGLSLTAEEALDRLARRLDLQISTAAEPARVHLDGTEVTDRLRGPEVTAAVSGVSAVPAVRAAMVSRQRALIGAGRIVVEGRDIGGTVVPGAAVKVYLTAAAAVRAARRSADAEAAAAGLETTAAALARRDAADSERRASPLHQAPGAVVLDTTDLPVDEVVRQIVALVPPEHR